jgi:hypothetical protein
VLAKGSVIALMPVATAADEGTLNPDAALQTISDELHKLGYKIIAPTQVRARLASREVDTCTRAATCDPALALATLQADAVLSTALWLRAAAPPQVVVHLRHRRGYGQAEVTSNGKHAKEMRAAALTALHTALDDSQRTHELTLHIESTPSGAVAHVDQTLSGRTPTHFSLLPGSHLVSIEAPGYVTHAQYVELEAGGGDSHINLTLEPAGLDGTDPASVVAESKAGLESAAPFETQPMPAAYREKRSSVLNYVVAAALFGVAAPFAANAIYGAATRNNCIGKLDADGRCGERVTLGPWFFASVGASAVAIAGGTTFLIVQPISGERSSVQGAQLRAIQRF